MLDSIKKVLLYGSMALLLLLISTNKVFANAAEPPSIVIIVPGATEDMKLFIVEGNIEIEARKIDKKWETYFTIYSRDLEKVNDFKIKVSSSKENFEIDFAKPLKRYNNIYVLKTKEKVLIEGKTISRSIKLVTLRILLTLMIEAMVFWIFGFRKKKSWIAFLIINVITQGGLNIWINTFPPLQSYLLFNVILGEIMVLIVELVVFINAVDEHKKSRRMCYVVASNLLSWIIGGDLISTFPI